MSSNERLTSRAPSGTRPWSIAARLALWYTCSAFVLVAVATGLLYWVLVSNVDREDDQMICVAGFSARARNISPSIICDNRIRTPLDVRRELAAVREFYEPAAAEAGVGLEIDGDTRPLIATLDRTLFQRALGNLITNAITHTPAGGRVRLSAGRIDDAVQIDVADTGVGIPPEHLARVSDRFYRVDASRSSASGGLGLGLAIVRSIVSVHGGSMQVLSDDGCGTTVRLVFPEISQTRPDVRTTHESETLASG